jgi:ribosomal protein L28
MFGHSISHSHTRSKRQWGPNVQDKRVWSDALDDWVSFKMTTAAMKASDNVGGIDNYIMSLENSAVERSNYLIKIRGLIGSRLYHRGLLHNSIIKHLGYDKVPPPLPVSE